MNFYNKKKVFGFWNKDQFAIYGLKSFQSSLFNLKINKKIINYLQSEIQVIKNEVNGVLNHMKEIMINF